MSQRESIALIGYRATGKTFFGRALARELRLPFVDMDEELAKILGMNIQEWVSASGWDSFRQAESRLLEELAGNPPMVLATGGGVVLSPSNRAILRRHFRVIWLKASIETIRRRLGEDPVTAAQRPALTDLPLEEEIRTLLASRLPLYHETAHLILFSDVESPRATVQRMLTFLKGTPMDAARDGIPTCPE